MAPHDSNNHNLDSASQSSSSLSSFNSVDDYEEYDATTADLKFRNTSQYRQLRTSKGVHYNWKPLEESIVGGRSLRPRESRERTVQPSSSYLHGVRSEDSPAFEGPGRGDTRAEMRDTSYPERSNVVQEWMSPGPTISSVGKKRLEIWRTFTQEQKHRIMQSEAEKNGIERPQGYTVSYHYNPAVESHHFGSQHPMKPWRLQLTKQLVLSYGLQYAMDLYKPLPATFEELADFHGREYLTFLSTVTPSNMEGFLEQRNRFAVAGIDLNQASDCPVFDGMWEYCQLYSGASIEAARVLVSGGSDIAINWSGGLHHAKKQTASGFCYINDIVLAIWTLATRYQRILYIDIDVHHGDGVEQAFHSTDRVMTLSFHRYDPVGFFPGSGGLHETGPKEIENPGAHYSLNVPLLDGIDDDQYTRLFEDVTGSVIEAYRPNAIVIQCGTDSLGGDRLGNFNLNIRAHGHCLDFVKRHCHDRPLLVLGGGGYTPRNVARTWCHETALCVGLPGLNDNLPGHVPYRQAFEGAENGDGKLYPWLHNLPDRHHKNMHTTAYLENIVRKIREELRYLKGAPGIVLQDLPPNVDELRAEVDAKLREEAQDRERDEGNRKRREENVGGRHEYRF